MPGGRGRCPTRGEILLDGKPVHFASPLDARAAGIETVYQNLAVCPALDIASNMFLGRERRRPGILRLGVPDARSRADAARRARGSSPTWGC